jgi:predicted transcriptional regulator
MLSTAQTKLLAIMQKGDLDAAETEKTEETEETLALLKILAISQADVDAGRVHTMDEVIEAIRAKRAPNSTASFPV